MRTQSKREDPLYLKRVRKLHEDGESCARCGAPYEPTHQVDHISPLFEGGSNDWSNLQPLCKECHKRKTAADLAASDSPEAEQAKRVRAIRSKKGMAWWKYGRR